MSCFLENRAVPPSICSEVQSYFWYMWYLQVFFKLHFMGKNFDFLFVCGAIPQHFQTLLSKNNFVVFFFFLEKQLNFFLVFFFFFFFFGKTVEYYFGIFFFCCSNSSKYFIVYQFYFFFVGCLFFFFKSKYVCSLDTVILRFWKNFRDTVGHSFFLHLLVRPCPGFFF